MTNTYEQAHQQAPTSPSLPLPTPASSSAAPSPALSSSSKFKLQPINIMYNKSLEPPQSSPRRGSIAAHLMSFASRSTTSLHLLSSSAPAHSSSSSSISSLDHEGRSQVLPLPRPSAFSNPFKKLQNTLHSHSNSSSSASSWNKSPELGSGKAPEKVVSSSSSVNSMVSWRSRGAEMLSKKPWGRVRKNSEPTYGAKSIAATPIFGASLEDAVRMSHIPGTPMVPAVLYRCAEYLEARGVDEVGLYRVPGSHASVQRLKKIFDTGKDYNLLAMDAIDPNDIATLLKLYLRELPTPLLPAVFLEQFQSVISTDRQVCHNLRGILISLPRPNYVVLSFLCHHLSRIAAHSEKTKMNVSNLGVVFAPTLTIGSVLFKALLGGYYDTADTPETRKLGLQIVWGGLLQGFDYSVQEWSENSQDLEHQSPNGDQASMMSNTHYQSAIPQPTPTPAQEIAKAASLAPPSSATTGFAFSQSMPSDHQYSPIIVPAPIESNVTAVSAEDEEVNLMTAMLLKEEMAVKRQEDDETASNASGSSGSIPCTDTTAFSTVSSPAMNAKEQAFEASFTSPSMAFSPTLASTGILSPSLPQLSSSSTTSSSAIPLHVTPSPAPSYLPGAGAGMTTKAATATYPATTPTINITIEAGSLFPAEGPLREEEEDRAEMEAAADRENAIHVPEFSHKSASGAPQLPPLEGLMIVL